MTNPRIQTVPMPNARTESILASNKMIRNTYMLLSMTLLFSALTAGLSLAMRLPHPGMVITLIGYFGLLFLTTKLRNSGWGLVSVFALTGFMATRSARSSVTTCACRTAARR